MNLIKPLPKELISKIAAGEVVEGPYSVVKELVENAIDAKTTNILIEIEKSGFDKIRVVDNGNGMNKEDLLSCFLPHTTSKIYKLEDLHNISTMGFRGEALNSISAVSHTKILSKTPQQKTGNIFDIEKETVKPTGMDTGTHVEVRNLFFSTPARKKFLKSEKTEFLKIIDVITKYALVYPNISFKLKHNKKVIINLPKQKPETRIEKVLGTPDIKKLIKVGFENEFCKIHGYLGKPQNSSYTSSQQFLFINKRPVENKSISKAIKTAYKNLIEAKAFPFFMLFIEIRPDLIDVNVHPRKTEVAFWNENTIYETFFDLITDYLEKENLTYQTDIFGNDLKKASAYEFNVLKDSMEKWEVKENCNNYENEPILQIDNNYLITTTKTELVLIDQHAAHESILYEQYLEHFENKLKNTKKIFLKPSLILNLSITQSNLLEQNIEILEKLGFSIEVFGKNSFKVSEIPELYKDHNIKNLLEELISEINPKKPLKVDEKTKQTIAFLACRGAVKAGDYLNEEERKRLVKKLAETKGYYTCPHGRPTQIKISKKDLDKMFKRI